MNDARLEPTAHTTAVASTVDVPTIVAQAQAVRDQQPLIQCLTNNVTVNLVANVLLAAGATPAMVETAGESEIFAQVASGILINLGTLHPAQVDGIRAIDLTAESTPAWVLDPVAVGALPIRTELAADLLNTRPTVIRGNASEIVALAGVGEGGRGVDSVHTPEDAADAARDLAQRTGGAVAVSGPVDLITDGTTTVRVSNGHPMLASITGGGCALGALTAAYAAVAPTPLIGAVAATVVYGIAGEQAAAASRGPGSFGVALLDALFTITSDDITAKAKLA